MVGKMLMHASTKPVKILLFILFVIKNVISLVMKFYYFYFNYELHELHEFCCTFNYLIRITRIILSHSSLATTNKFV